MIQTKFHDQVDLNEVTLTEFVSPLLGFETESEFVVLPLEEDSPFSVLQSIHEPDLALFMLSPWAVEEDYAFDLTPEQLDVLELEQPEDVRVYGVVTLAQNPVRMTINLRSPIILNAQNNKAMQIVLQGTDYHMRHQLATEEA